MGSAASAEKFTAEVAAASADDLNKVVAGLSADEIKKVKAGLRNKGQWKDRVFASPGKGGTDVDPAKTALLFIEFQNEFCTEGGKLYEAVKENMATTGMLDNAAKIADEARAAGVKVFHAPITFAEDGSDNPNAKIGILAGCAKDKLFTRDTWNAAFCDKMTPQSGDVVINGKRGLSAFPATDLEEQLQANGIETIVLGGFMADCCVESTMRDACEKGFNVITLTDCVATTTLSGYKGAVEISYGFFSQPMTAEAFKAKIVK